MGKGCFTPGLLLGLLGFRYPRRWLAFCAMGMWSWSMIKVVCAPSIIDAPWTPSPLVSAVSSLHHNLHPCPQSTSLQKFLWTPLLMEAPFAGAPEHDAITFPSPRLHWVMVYLGTESGKVIIKVARRARVGQTLPPRLQGNPSPLVWGLEVGPLQQHRQHRLKWTSPCRAQGQSVGAQASPKPLGHYTRSIWDLLIGGEGHPPM